jgi:hypothetical protein
MMAIEIRTDHFEFNHGRAPRGYGRWAFAEDPRESAPSKMVWYTGKWSDARKSAIAWCRIQKIDQLFVMP